MKNDKTVSKLADARTEQTVLPSQSEHIQVQLQISAKACEWYICRGFCAFRAEDFLPVSFYLFVCGGWGERSEPDRAAGRPRITGKRRAPPYREGIVLYIEKVKRKLEERDESEQEKCGTELMEYGTGNLCRDCRNSWNFRGCIMRKNHSV